MASGSNSRGLVLLLITSCFFITGLLFDYMPMIIDDHIKRTIELATNEEIIGFWSKPPVEVHSYYWLYDISNAEQFQRAGEKPRVRKVGPFHFNSRIEKRLIELSANKFRLTYNSTRYMTLDDSYSAELLDEPLQLLNPILVSIIEGVRVSGQELDGQARAVATASVNRLFDRYNETIVANVTARVALLGRAMPIVDKLRKIAETFGMADRLPEMPPAGSKLGYVALANGTWSGPFEIYTGYQETAESLGDLISYRGKRRLDYYEGKCNRLQVSAGELRPMPIEPERRLEIFSPNFCRVLHLQPTGQVKLREGQAINYRLAPEDFLSAQSNPDNRCFCTNITHDDDHCSKDGVVELAPCSHNAPILITLSNMQLDPKITETIRDFDADILRGELEQLPAADDDAQFVVLKRVGVPIKADLTITLMMKLIRDPSFKQTANVPDVSYVPLMTVRESVSIPPKLAQIIINLESFLSLTYHIKVVMYLTTIVLLCWLTGHYYCRTSAQVNAEHRGAGNDDADPNEPKGAARLRRSPTGGSGANENSPPFANDQTGVNLSGGRQQRLSIGSPLQAGAAPFLAGTEQETANATALTNANGLETGAPGGRFRRSARPQLRTVEEAITQAAQTNDPTSGERANSADSSRSLPPSGPASRLDSFEAGNSPSIDQPAPISGAGEISDEPPICSQPTRVARIFSKVDEELRARSNQTTGDNATWTSPPLGDQLVEGQKTAAESGALTGRPRKRRKGWFMNVYSRFVSMLSGIRNSIEDASQLDLKDNDYQDKRLEMLAGKIDNWYSSAPLDTGPDEGTGRASPADERSANTGNREPAEMERDDGRAAGSASDARDMMQPRPAMSENSKTKRPASRSVAADQASARDNGPAASRSDSGARSEGASRNQRSSPSGRTSKAAREPQSGDEGGRLSSGRSKTMRAQQMTKVASDGTKGASGQPQQDGAGQMTVLRPPSRPDAERDKTIQARPKRSVETNTANDGDGGAGGSVSPGDAASMSNNNETASLTNGEFGAVNEDDNDDDDDDEADESEEEARGCEQEEADKAATLRRIEDALGEADKSQPAGGGAVKRADSADSTSGRMASSELDVSTASKRQPPRVAMINSSTSIDSVINSTALYGDDVSGSSFDSCVTQVATSRPNEEGSSDRAAAAAAAAAAAVAAAVTGSALNQSAGDETATGPENERVREQIDESSGAGQRQRRQSNKWLAAGNSADVIDPAGEQLANSRAGGDLPSGSVRESAKLSLATSRGPDLSNAPMARDNGRSAAKLDARNGISGAAVGEPAASSLTRLPDKTAPASVNGKPDGPSGDLAANDSDQAANKTTGRPNRAHALGPAAQVNGLVVATGQPINVGTPPTITKSLIGPHGGPHAPLAASNLLLPNGGSRHASKRPPPLGNNSVTRPAAFQASQNGRWIRAERAGGNNILNEKIISHQQPRPRRRPEPRQKKRTDGGPGVLSSLGFNSGSNQGSANQTTGNHHHQRVQPAGV